MSGPASAGALPGPWSATGRVVTAITGNDVPAAVTVTVCAGGVTLMRENAVVVAVGVRVPPLPIAMSVSLSDQVGGL